MHEPLVVVGAIGAGSLFGAAVLVAAYERLGHDAGRWLARQRAGLGAVLYVAAIRRRLARDIGRAGWRESPERVAVLAIAGAICLAVLGASVSFAVSILGFIGGCGAFVLTLNAAVLQRRRRLSGELVPLLELFTLELSGGGSALAALGSVCVQVESELAIALRRLLIASQVVGSASFEARLLEYADELEIPALASLATILAASRDYGTAASQGVRALATDLRRAQRRELIAQSRRALNNVLLPAAVAVLLPFLGVLMFPAVSVLQRSLR
jgi:Flp pilus assembly protein TadB